MKHNYVLLWVRPDGDVSMNATYSETMTQFADMTGSMGDLKADFTTNTLVHHRRAGADREAGEDPPGVLHRQPAILHGRDARVSGLEAPGRRRPGGQGLSVADHGHLHEELGGHPAERHRGEREALHRFRPQRGREPVQRDRDAGVLAAEAAGEGDRRGLRGDTALLEVEGVLFGKQKGLYLVQMVKRDSRWVFDRAMKAGFLD